MRKAAIVFACSIMLLTGVAARAEYIKGDVPVCDWRSLTHPGALENYIQPGRQNYSRDFPQGTAGTAPTIDTLDVNRDYPFPGEFVTIRMFGQVDGSSGDSVEAQFLMWGEIGYSPSNGTTWYANGSSGTSGRGLPMDWFVREKLGNIQGANLYKQYVATSFPWQVSRVSAAWIDGDPAPNRRGSATNNVADTFPNFPMYPGWGDGFESLERYKTWGVDVCPWSLNCPLYDTYPSNSGSEAANPPRWPENYGGVTCSRGNDVSGTSVAGEDNCNVPGFPEGGGDLLDYYAACDPADPVYPCDPYPQAFPNIPGEPFVRVNGVPGISCDVYINSNVNWAGVPSHPLCDGSAKTDIVDPVTGKTTKEVYDDYGIKAYTINPMQGVVKFADKLTSSDVVDAVFYTSGRRYWTARISLMDSTFPAAMNQPGSQFIFYPRLYDTCGNVASGARAHAPMWPNFNPSNNEAITYVLGGDDSDWDMIPTDLDPLASYTDDVVSTQCCANDPTCGATGGLSTSSFCMLGRPATAPCPTEPGCECCYNECQPTVCQHMQPYKTMCSTIGDAGNPPGCGPEFGGGGNSYNNSDNVDMLEIHEFKLSHSTANLYMKLQVKGDMQWGCYGVWYIPIVACEFDLSCIFGNCSGNKNQMSKFNGYAFQIVNANPAEGMGGTYYLIVVPSIEGLYGPITVFLDLPKLLGDLGSTYNYDGTYYEPQYAQGACADMCAPPTSGGDPCDDLGCEPGAGDPPNGPDGDCDEDTWNNENDECPCSAADPDSSQTGCPPEEPDEGFDKYMCQACQIEGGDGSPNMIIEMGYDATVGNSALAPYSILAMTISLHSINFDSGPDSLLCLLCNKGFKFNKLGSDISPNVNYYTRGELANDTVTVHADAVAPMAPEIEGCLGRCDAIDPSTTTIMLQWNEVVFNDDGLYTDLVDLGGYKISMNRGGNSAWSHYYSICSPNETDDCSSMSPNDGASPPVYIPRTDKAMDEPYAGTRFPKPFDELKPYSGFNYPGEPVTMIIDSDCDIIGNNFDDDKDLQVDEGCYSGAPDLDETALTHSNSFRDADLSLAEDGQEYWFNVLSYDSDPDWANPLRFPSVGTFHAMSKPSNIAKVKILRNTIPPATPTVEAVYPMGSGRSLRVVWNQNRESDIGGYAVYRCPYKPIDAVLMVEGALAADYCLDDDNYRRVNEPVLNVFNSYFTDDGKGFYEGGATNDDDGDGTLYEWIECEGYVPDTNDAELTLCGNMSATWTVGTSFTLYQATDPDRPVLFPTGLVDGYAYYYKLRAIDSPYRGDGSAVPGTCDSGVTSWYYLNGSDAEQGGRGCINPIDNDPIPDPAPPYLTGRTCTDPTVKNDWAKGGNCSTLSEYVVKRVASWDVSGNKLVKYYVVLPAGDLEIDNTNPADPYLSLWGKWSIGTPRDTKAPGRVNGIKATVNPSGESIYFTWNGHQTVDYYDVTFDHYRIYRSDDYEGIFACLRGSCETAPYRDGCPCAADADCSSNDCDIPWKICTDPPDYTITPVDTDCPNAGCECSTDADCNSGTTGRTCAYPPKGDNTGLCMSVNTDPDLYTDNDGDGLIDEELSDATDNDGDGLVDEDIVTGNMYTVGKCPSGDFLKHATMSEVIYTNYFTDRYLTPGKTYFYKITAVDNAVYKDLEEDNEAPNESGRSDTMIVSTRDTEAPQPPTGLTAELHGDDVPPSDLPGNSMTLIWFAGAEDDIAGYRVYRAADTNGGSPPTPSEYNLLNETLVEHPEPTATDTVYFKDTNLDSGVEYYYLVKVVDEHNNESNPSAVAGPVTSQDQVAPETPEWNPDYRDHPNCKNDCQAPACTCTTTVNHTCDAGGVTVYGKTGSLKIDWAPQAESVCNPTSTTEGDFAYYNLYRRYYAAATGTATCDSTTNTNCAIAGNDCRVATGLTDTEYIDKDLVNDKTYYYCLTAVDRNGNESATSTVEFNAPEDNMPPDKPDGLIATPLAAAKVGLGWNLLDSSVTTDIAGYVIYRATTNSESAFTVAARIDVNDTEPNRVTIDQEGDTVEAIDGNSYVDDYNLIPSRTYYYKITAIDSSGNESQKSDVVAVTTSDTDTTAPTTITEMWSRAGYDKGESAPQTAGVDDDGDGIIDDANLKELEAELHWTAVKDPDLVSYNVYRLDPPVTENCSITSDPTGDCDQDGIANSNDPSCETCCGYCPLDDCDKDGDSNAIDSCPCSPLSPDTAPFGTYTKLNTTAISKTTVCPAAAHARPEGTLSENTCYYTDSNVNEGLCNGSRYWYIVTGVDSATNETRKDTTYAHPVTPVEKPDTTAPEQPIKEGQSYDWKRPKIIASPEGGKLTVLFYENDMTKSKNQDIQGYTIYRDTSFNGDYNYERNMFLSGMTECNEPDLPDCHCDKANSLEACRVNLYPDEPVASRNNGVCELTYWVDGKTYDCYLDTDVINETKYYYMVDAFDEVPNHSPQTESGSSKPKLTETIPAPVGFQVQPTVSDPNTLVLTWSMYGLENNPNFDGFMMYRANSASGTYQVIDPEPTTTAIELLESTTLIEENLVSGQRYNYLLYAVDVNGAKSDDPAVCCRGRNDCSQYYCYGVPGSDVTPPLPPTGLISVAESVVNLTWNAPSAPDLAGYNICRTVTPELDSSWTKINTSAVTYPAHTDAAVTSGTLYWYYVSAYDENYDTADDTACDPTNVDTNDSAPSQKVSASPGVRSFSRTAAKGWNLVAIPAAEGRSTSRELTATGGGTSAAAAVLFDPETGKYAPGSLSDDFRIPQGRAFWLYSDSDDTVLTWQGELNTSDEVIMPLAPKWSLIGNPFPNQLDWNNGHIEFSVDSGATWVTLGQALDSGMLLAAWRYDNGRYDRLNPGDSLLVGDALWLKTSQRLSIKIKK